MNNPGGVEGSGAFAPLPGCVFVMKRVVPGCVLPHDPGLSAPIPPGCLHAGGVGAGSPGCEATPGHGRKRMNNPGGVEDQAQLRLAHR